MSSSPLHRSMSDEPIDLTNEDTKSSAPRTNGNSTSSTTINSTSPSAGKTRGSGSGSGSTSGGRSIQTKRAPPTLTSIVEENPERYDYETRVVDPFKAQQAMNAERKKKTMRKQFSHFAATIKNALLALNGGGL
ncbi:uncharacterized protein STEHIDRAFT_154854 [Stereum hirsutum FP-91666 SS1]|uniref:uncharacterized protein n=1 Tax=Stereum hirsutum (strain FP-91666) TaxID=721885 RepID=UPI000440E290|nr:uncharacterized protein STEHIDRAFT_154854 [Stereum hirsutum FP-91666 SS1]EIM89172.1 hypothetical protein STEHIDRAFT_154854 [Stereum hirsutum FP-91666 SS1]